MTNGYVSITAHDEQENAARELIDPRGYHVRFAHDVTERPLAYRHGDDQERYPDQEALVGNGQVHYVHVGHGLHLRIPEHHVDDQGVAHESHHADDPVYHLGHQIDHGHFELAAHREGVVARPVPGHVRGVVEVRHLRSLILSRGFSGIFSRSLYVEWRGFHACSSETWEKKFMSKCFAFDE